MSRRRRLALAAGLAIAAIGGTTIGSAAHALPAEGDLEVTFNVYGAGAADVAEGLTFGISNSGSDVNLGFGGCEGDSASGLGYEATSYDCTLESGAYDVFVTGVPDGWEVSGYCSEQTGPAIDGSIPSNVVFDSNQYCLLNVEPASGLSVLIQSSSINLELLAGLTIEAFPDGGGGDVLATSTCVGEIGIDTSFGPALLFECDLADGDYTLEVSDVPDEVQFVDGYCTNTGNFENLEPTFAFTIDGELSYCDLFIATDPDVMVDLVMVDDGPFPADVKIDIFDVEGGDLAATTVDPAEAECTTPDFGFPFLINDFPGDEIIFDDFLIDEPISIDGPLGGVIEFPSDCGIVTLPGGDGGEIPFRAIQDIDLIEPINGGVDYQFDVELPEYGYAIAGPVECEPFVSLGITPAEQIPEDWGIFSHGAPYEGEGPASSELCQIPLSYETQTISVDVEVVNDDDGTSDGSDIKIEVYNTAKELVASGYDPEPGTGNASAEFELPIGSYTFGAQGDAYEFSVVVTSVDLDAELIDDPSADFTIDVATTATAVITADDITPAPTTTTTTTTVAPTTTTVAPTSTMVVTTIDDGSGAAAPSTVAPTLPATGSGSTSNGLALAALLFLICGGAAVTLARRS